MDILKKWMIVRFKPYKPPYKMDVLPKTLVQIIFAAKCLLRHSSTSPNQQHSDLTFSFPSVFILLL